MESEPSENEGGPGEPTTSEEGQAPPDAPAAEPRKRRKKRRQAPPPPAPPPPPSRRPSGWLVVVLVLVGGAIAAYFALRKSGDWAVGRDVSVELTVVASDKTNLACAFGEEIGAKHCGFEALDKPWAKPGESDAVLQPYTTTDRRVLLGAGLWSQPAMTGPLPTTRFTVRCTLSILGAAKKPSVRWATTGPWSEAPEAVFAGTLKDCAIVPAPAPSTQPAVGTSSQ